jgi:hypothetical protein
MVLTPHVANAAAQATPVRPPPTMTTDVEAEPRNGAYTGRRLAGKAARKYG